VGIQAEFHYETNWPSFSAMLAQGKFPIFLYAWSADVPHPDNFLFKLFYSRSPRNFTVTRTQWWMTSSSSQKERDLQRQTDLYRQAEQVCSMTLQSFRSGTTPTSDSFSRTSEAWR